MGNYSKHSLFHTLLILGLGFVLLLARMNQLHMHLEHDDHASGHVVAVHISSTLHDYELTHHHDDLINQDDHHSMAINISSDSLITKVNILNPLVLILLVIGLFLLMPHLTCRIRQRFYRRRFTPQYYFFQPPLRAPPVTYYG